MVTAIVKEIITHGENDREKIAIVANGEQITYGDFSKLIKQAANYLANKGINSGDRVVLEAYPSIEFISFYFATHLLNAISVPLDVNYTEKNFHDIAEEVEASLILTFNKNISKALVIKRDQIETLLPFKEINIVSRSEADIIFTSGTTGKPKGVVLSHLSMFRGAENIIEGTEMKEDTVNLLGVPIHHAFGLGTLRALLLKGATVVLINGFSSLKTIKRTYDQYRCNAVSIVPSALNILNKLCKERLDYLFTELRYFEFGSASINEKMLNQLLFQFPNSNIYASYGSTESPRTMYVNLAQYPSKINTIGRPVSNVQVSIFDENLKPVQSSVDNIGRVGFSGEMNSIRYWKNEEESQKSFKQNLYLSNDLGYITEDGFVVLIGRVNDMLNIGGKKIPASTIENIINKIEGVHECACIGVLDDTSVLGEVPVVFMVADNKISENEIMSRFKTTNNTYIQPQKIIFIQNFPLNRMGKIDKRLLKESLNLEK